MIEIGLFVGLGLMAMAGVVGAYMAKAGDRRTERWMQAARLAGLTDVAWSASLVRTPAVRGRHRTLQVALEPYRDVDTRNEGSTIVVTGLPPELEIQRDAGVSLGALLRPASVKTGDEGFDASIRVTGSPRLALALLDAATRERVLDVFCVRLKLDGRAVVTRQQRAHVAGGRLTFDCPRPRAGDEAETLAAYLGEVIKVADALTPPESLEVRLLANVRSDREPAVRLANLRELLAGDTGAPALREALRVAVEDGDENVQLEAAIGLGGEGRATLQEIATRSWSSDTCAARAVSELRSALPAVEAAGILRRALAESRWETAEACLETLGLSRAVAHLDLVTEVLRVHRAGVAAAAARAIGRIGNAQSIAHLRDAESRFPRERAEVYEAFRHAIAAIRARLVDAEAGQVSLAAADEGRVSLTRDQAGQVSIERKADPA